MRKNKVYLICGGRAAGKTSVLKKVAELLQGNEISLKGFYAKAYGQHNLRTHYDLVNITDHSKLLLATIEKKTGFIEAGRCYFNPEAIRMGEFILREVDIETDLMVIDEIGNLEYKGLIWFTIIREMLSMHEQAMIWCVRDSFLEKIIGFFALDNFQVFDIGKISPQQIAASVYNDLISIR